MARERAHEERKGDLLLPLPASAVFVVHTSGGNGGSPGPVTAFSGVFGQTVLICGLHFVSAGLMSGSLAARASGGIDAANNRTASTTTASAHTGLDHVREVDLAGLADRAPTRRDAGKHGPPCAHQYFRAEQEVQRGRTTASRPQGRRSAFPRCPQAEQSGISAIATAPQYQRGPIRFTPPIPGRSSRKTEGCRLKPREQHEQISTGTGRDQQVRHQTAELLAKSHVGWSGVAMAAVEGSQQT